jgi:alkanesulfonate monooxygenase SsuD/methylene tetrahydromethanopterin reductase-like flavin-dependent oxidoreductase (luciferase family)
VQPDLPMWIGGGSDAAIQRTARYGTGWQGGGEAPEEAARIVAAIKQAAKEHDRAIDEDHYGAGIPFYFGSANDSVVAAVMTAYNKRTGRDPARVFAIGDEETVLDRIGEFVAGGVSKFILRPVGVDGDGVQAQTKRLIEKLLPEVERRWPRH